MRIFHYSHDTYGLGHIRRTLAIAEQLALDFPQASQLVVSGTPQPSCFNLPSRLDFIKLPDIDKPFQKKFHAPSLLLQADALKSLRENMILDAMRFFKPDLVLVDKAPAGVRGELLPSLRYLQNERPETKLVLGMCDIEDNAMIARENDRTEIPLENPVDAVNVKDTIRGQWRDQGIHALLENHYNLILHYGNREIYDPVSEYRLSGKIERKMISCGHIGRSSPTLPKEQLRRSLNLKTDRLVVVTAGGGEDGFELLNFYLKTLSHTLGTKSSTRSQDPNNPPFDSIVIPGPLMSMTKRRQLQAYRSMGLPFTLLDSTNNMFSYLNAADLVISKGGYNSICEILSLNKRAIIVPHTKPRVEQLIRAGRLAVRGLVEMIHPQKLTASTLLKKIQEGLEPRERVSPEETGLNMNGALNASQAIERLLGTNAAFGFKNPKRPFPARKGFTQRVYAETVPAFS